MSKELREFCSLDDISLDISKHVVAQSLDNLWNIKECHVDRVAFQCAHGILNDEWIVLELGQEVGHRSYGVYCSPVKQVLAGLA